MYLEKAYSICLCIRFWLNIRLSYNVALLLLYSTVLVVDNSFYFISVSNNAFRVIYRDHIHTKYM